VNGNAYYNAKCHTYERKLKQKEKLLKTVEEGVS
jgi:hypothetical protein